MSPTTDRPAAEADAYAPPRERRDILKAASVPIEGRYRSRSCNGEGTTRSA